MNKVPFSDGSGHWFDIDTAKVWEERVSRDEAEYRKRFGPEEERLYLTRKGTLVLYRWDWHIEEGLYRPLDKEKATRWLIVNGYQADIAKLELQAEERDLEW